ncbi:MAG: DNA polymerase/3'-5' exonuclease PolX [Nitrososphaerota archaeon]
MTSKEDLTNAKIAKLLRNVAAAYAVKGGNFFKVTAYQKAADAIEHATSEVKDLWDDNKLDQLPGVGLAIRSHLDELFRTGRVRHFENVMKGLPSGMFNILGVPGIGPKTAFKLASTLGIENIDELEDAANQGKISKIAGFGEKSQKEILESIAEFRRLSGRHLLPIAYENASKVIDYLIKIPEVIRADPLGSLRRMVATVGDIDIAVAAYDSTKVIKHFIGFPEASRVLEAGKKTASIILRNGLQVDLMVQKPEGYGALLQHFTGSKQHNIHLRQLALSQGMSLSEYGIRVGERLEIFDTEENFYKRIGLDWIPPELREDMGEIEAAMEHTLPDLVRLDQIRGDLHVHSSYPIETSHDYGTHGFELLINKAIELGYEYLGFSDHNPSVSEHTEDQVVALIKKRKTIIEQYNYSSKINLLNLLEVDILADGRLALPSKAFDYLDGIIAGVHSSMRQPKDVMTNRLLKAIANPFVTIISHPTGRLLKEREGYELDWPRIFSACLQYNKILEINAWPSRLDLPDVIVRDAVRQGIKLIINTDSHAVEHMDNMKYGVAVARRGWAEAKNIINTLPWLAFRKYFMLK